MQSKSRETRENQKKLYDQRLQERQADLKKKGLTSKDFNKDKVYEHLKGKQRSIVKAIAAIDARNARNEHHKEEAAEQAAPEIAIPKDKKPKKEKVEKPKKAEKAAPAKAGA